MGAFRDAREFRTVFDCLFDTMSRDERFGPPLRARRTPQKFVFTDFGLELHVADSDDRRAATGQHLVWVWGGGKRTWKPKVTLSTDSETANLYFMGEVNVPMAILTGRLRITDGSPVHLLWTIPILYPFHGVWQQVVREKGWSHLLPGPAVFSGRRSARKSP
jgi:hypothetical protein